MFLEESIDVHNGEVIAKTTALDHDQVLSWLRGICLQGTKTCKVVVRILGKFQHLREVACSVVPVIGEHMGPLEDPSSAGIQGWQRIPACKDWIESFILPGAHDCGTMGLSNKPKWGKGQMISAGTKGKQGTMEAWGGGEYKHIPRNKENRITNQNTPVTYVFSCRRIKRSMKNRPSTWQGGGDYWTVSKLYL